MKAAVSIFQKRAHPPHLPLYFNASFLLGLALSVGIESCNTEHILPLTQAISSKGNFEFLNVYMITICHLTKPNK